MNNVINANPTKEFFISMLTRDIDIKAAIIELIDNSIDGAKRLRDSDYTGLYIKIELDEDRFIIEDNCGGISIDIAKNRAFRFGRSHKTANDGYYTGVFGIGMKRSLFRLGRNFIVISKCETESFEVKVDVDEWIKDENTDWTFKFNKVHEKDKNPIENCGTRIEVTKLIDGISKSFKLEYFITSLISYIEKYRTITVENGLEITVNGKKIAFAKEGLISSDRVKPFVRTERVDDVEIKVISGLAPKGKPANAGWYIYCNGRLIVHADRSELTGWGIDEVCLYHPRFAGFRGFVFFDSKELEKLPWNTTKTNVDTSSMLYIYARTLMKEAILQINELLNEINNIDDKLEKIETEKHIYNDQKLIKLTTEKLESISSKNMNFTWNLPPKELRKKMSTITFRRSFQRVEQLKEMLNVNSNKEVGEFVFDYYIKRECDE